MQKMLNGNIMVSDVEQESNSVLIIAEAEKRYRVVTVIKASEDLPVKEGDTLWVFSKAGFVATHEGKQVRIINKGDVISIV